MTAISKEYSFEPSRAGRAAIAAACAAACACGALFCRDAAAEIAWCALVLEAATWSACDAQARLLPTPLTVAFALTAAVWQLLVGGPAGLAWAAVVGGCVAVGFGALSAMFALLGKPSVFGAGDLKLVGPCGLAAGVGGFPAAALSFTVITIAWFAAMAARKSLSMSTSLPFGPFLAAFALVGAGYAAWSAGGAWLFW